MQRDAEEEEEVEDEEEEGLLVFDSNGKRRTGTGHFYSALL